MIDLAGQHDWFIKATANGAVVVKEIVSYAGDKPATVNTLQFTNFDRLRAWAGY